MVWDVSVHRYWLDSVSYTHLDVYKRQAFNLAKGVWAEDTAGEDTKAAFQREMILPLSLIHISKTVPPL